MKNLKFLFLTTLIFVTYFCFSQASDTSKNKMFFFDEGKWKVFGIVSSMRNGNEKIGDFFTEDKDFIKILAEKSTKYRPEMHVFTFDYLLHFIKDDTTEILGELRVDSSFFNPYLKKFKTIPVTYYKINSIEKARKLYYHFQSMKDARIDLRWHKKYWLNYSGELMIKITENLFNDEKQMDDLVYNKIKNDYPNEVFEVVRSSRTTRGKISTEYKYYIYCSEQMGMSFKTFPVTWKWHKFDDIEMYILGLSKEEVDKIVEKL